MHKILVPIKKFSWLSLSAAYFAIEFAKRNPTKILFLLFSPSPEGSEPASGKKADSCPKQFDALIQQARTDKINLELLYSNEEYMKTVQHFARDHNISEIIIAVPPVQDPIHNKIIQQIESLRNSVTSQIVIVRTKEDWPMPTDRKNKEGEKLTPLKSRTVKEGT
jgi:hypothetical protein